MFPAPIRLASIALALIAPACSLAAQSANWAAYNGGVDGRHYSALKQIDRSNVAHLTRAWTFDTGEAGSRTGLETNPLIVAGTLYAYTPSQKVLALDAATGKLKWTFDSGIDGTQPTRGFAWWPGSARAPGSGPRLFAGIMNYLYCLDPATGRPIPSFGENGRIDLRKGLREPYQEQSIDLTTPGVIYKDLIIVGGRNPETHPAPPGDIRAFDVRTGALRWVFHTIPRPGEPGYGTWPPDAWKTAGAANNWAGMALDVEHGIVYAPTGSAVMDFYGGDRIGNDLYADSLLAIDAATGKLLWYFQGVHHDLWDRDFPSPPALFTVVRNGRAIPAIAQTSKQGWLYLFNRLTGQPLYPIAERPCPPSTVPGEEASPTQPLPAWPAPFARQLLTAGMLTTRTPAAHASAVKEFATFRSDGQFVPFSLEKQTVIFPGFDGGAEWGGPAIDPATNVLYVNASEMAWTGGLVAASVSGGDGERIFQQSCALCHGVDRRGSPPDIPSLIGVGQRLSPQAFAARLHNGGGRMPAYPDLKPAEAAALLDYLNTGSSPARTEQPGSGRTEIVPTHTVPEPYLFTGYRRFLDPDGYPAIAPPWGTLNAIDLNTGKYLWKIPLGEYPALARQGLADTGCENYGGPVVTAGGVLFIASTIYDRKFRAFDTRTGKLLWQADLPYAGVATPSTYMVHGRQYVVIATSDGRDAQSPQGAAYVAFALPGLVGSHPDDGLDRMNSGR